MNINVRVTNSVQILNFEKIGSGSVNDVKMIFELSEEMKKMVQMAVFTTDKSYTVQIISNECTVPSEVLINPGTVIFGVYGFEKTGQEFVKRISPIATKFNVLEGSYVDGQEPSPGTPNAFEIYITQCIDLKNQTKAFRDETQIFRQNTEEFDKSAKQSSINALQSENKSTVQAEISTAQAQVSTTQAVISKTKATEAETSKVQAQQALTDLLAMLGSDVATLIGGKIPMRSNTGYSNTRNLHDSK